MSPERKLKNYVFGILHILILLCQCSCLYIYLYDCRYIFFVIYLSVCILFVCLFPICQVTRFSFSLFKFIAMIKINCIGSALYYGTCSIFTCRYRESQKQKERERQKEKEQKREREGAFAK